VTNRTEYNQIGRHGQSSISMALQMMPLSVREIQSATAPLAIAGVIVKNQNPRQSEDARESRRDFLIPGCPVLFVLKTGCPVLFVP